MNKRLLLLLRELFSSIPFRLSNNMNENTRRNNRLCMVSSIGILLWNRTTVSVCTEYTTVFSPKPNLRQNSDFGSKVAGNVNESEFSVGRQSKDDCYFWPSTKLKFFNCSILVDRRNTKFTFFDLIYISVCLKRESSIPNKNIFKKIKESFSIGLLYIRF